MSKKIISLGLISLFILMNFSIVSGVEIETGIQTSSMANEIWVPDDYPTIQSAIDAAKDGDAIRVRADIYFENIVVDKSINLIGENKDTTIIDGGEKSSVIEIKSSSVEIQDFTLRNSELSGFEAGIIIPAKTPDISDIHISGCIITDCLPAIRLNSYLLYQISDISITNCILHDNQGGLSMELVERAMIENCKIYNNGEYLDNGYIRSGGIKCHDCSDISIVNCSIYDGLGCAISFDGENFAISNNNLYGFLWGGISIGVGTSVFKIHHNKIYNNHDRGILVSSIINGGSSFDNVIHDNEIYNNGDKGDYYDGGVIVQHCSDGIAIKNNNISSNAKYGIFLLESSSNVIVENDISDNVIQGICTSHDSNNNHIYHNNFINNNQNAYDQCDNIWNDGEKGNYWDDYEEKVEDANKKPLKGIWDKPYPIDGGNNQDNYPLLKPYGKSKSRSAFPILINVLNRFFDNHPGFFQFLKDFLV